MTAESRVHPRPTRVAVVGVGSVGATFAYALLLSGLAAEIVLIDANRAKAEGEAMDLNHTVPFAHPTRIWAAITPIARARPLCPRRRWKPKARRDSPRLTQKERIDLAQYCARSGQAQSRRDPAHRD